MTNKSKWNFYSEGMHLEWPFSFSMKEMGLFADISGDHNPIHSNIDFARSKGFDGPLVHGVLLTSQISRLVGQELPDKNAVLTNIEIEFIKPALPGELLTFKADLIHKSEATFAIEFKCQIFADKKLLCRGMVGAVWRP